MAGCREITKTHVFNKSLRKISMNFEEKSNPSVKGNYNKAITYKTNR